MVFLFILLLVILMLLTIQIKIELTDIKISSNKKEHIDKNYEIKFIIYTLKKIPIFKLTINNKKIKKIMENKKIMSKIKEQETKIIENRKNIDKETIKALKNIKIQVEKINLKILIGTENASLTAFIVPVISTIIAITLREQIKKYNENQKFLIQPIYINQNLINIECSGIFEIEMIHIINTICIVNKKRKGDKNERTSNRRSYDYGYE